MNNQTIQAWIKSNEQDTHDFYMMRGLLETKQNFNHRDYIFDRNATALYRHISAYQDQV